MIFTVFSHLKDNINEIIKLLYLIIVLHDTLQALNVLLGVSSASLADTQRQISLVTARIDRNQSIKEGVE